jgi:hypothetical protein
VASTEIDEEVRFAADSAVEEAVSSELVSEVGFPAPVEKAGFQGFCG